MKRIAILYGGRSGEHEVSLLSAASILRNLDKSFFEPVLIGIVKEGEWLLQSRESTEQAISNDGPLGIDKGFPVYAKPGAGLFAQFPEAYSPLHCDAVFPVLHGTFGEDGTIQGFLEVADLPYVGASVLGSALGMDKEKAKSLWISAGLPTVPFHIVREPDISSPSILAVTRQRVEDMFGWPAFAKPASGGSSVGATIIPNETVFESAVRAALEWDEKVMVEPFIQAREIECSILGNERLEAFTPGEILPSHEFYDYEAKYLDPNGARLEIPARISSAQDEFIRRIAVAACKACELEGMARVDFFINKDSGEILLNEVNTIPGFTQISMYPKMCEAGGIPYPTLITRLIELGIERHKRRKAIRFSR